MGISPWEFVQGTIKMKSFNSTQLKYAFAVVALGALSSCGKQTSDEYLKQAQQYVVENNPAAAIVALKNAVQTEPKSAKARFELGNQIGRAHV